MKSIYNNKFHIVKPSPWGYLTGIGIGSLAIGIASRLHRIETRWTDIIVLIGLGLPIWLWSRDICRESTLIGKHTKEVSKSIKIGFIWMLISEVFFFIGVIGTYLYSKYSPTIWTGSTWPDSIGLSRMVWTNTISLLTSGCTLTLSHMYLHRGDITLSRIYLLLTLILGGIFICIQGKEYIDLDIYINEGISGSCFFLTTGFHGLHVIVGCLLLFISFIRLNRGSMTSRRNVGLTCFAWYWHFVDIVWLFLFVIVYWL